MEFLFPRAKAVVLAISLGVFISISISSGSSANATCKSYPECGEKGAVCKKRICENCKKLWVCACEKGAYVHSYYDKNDTSVQRQTCEKTCI